MAPDERSRTEVSQALAAQLGPAAAAALMECIPPFGWHEIATKSDLAGLASSVTGGLNSLAERMDLRFEGSLRWAQSPARWSPSSTDSR